MSNTYEKILSEIRDLLREKPYLKEKDGYFTDTLAADYRDELSAKTVCKILDSDDPQLACWEELDAMYEDAVWYEKCELQKDLLTNLIATGGRHPDGLTAEEEAAFYEAAAEIIAIDLPYDHFLKQEFCVNLMVDTGDGNYDYTLNGVYPCWYGSPDDRMDDRAALAWLTKTQGCTKTQLRNALRQGDMRGPKGYLESVRVELANLTSHMSVLTFMVKMTLEQLMQVNEMLKMRDKDDHKYDASKRPYCGYLEISKDTECGLYDPWYGGGSVLEIQLEKDLRLPVKYLRSALPDGGDGYEIHGVYGVSDALWTSGGVKGIHVPQKAKAE